MPLVFQDRCCPPVQPRQNSRRCFWFRSASRESLALVHQPLLQKRCVRGTARRRCCQTLTLASLKPWQSLPYRNKCFDGKIPVKHPLEQTCSFSPPQFVRICL